MNLQQLIEQYLTYQKALGWRPPSHGGCLGHFGRTIGARADIADVRPEQVRAFLIGAGSMTRTWHNKYSALRCFYHYAISRGYVTTAPLPAVVPPRPRSGVPYIYSQEELRRILQAADTVRRPRGCLEPVTMRTAILLLYGAGLRLQEVLNLNQADVDWEASLLTIRRTKFLKTRAVPFGPQLGQALRRYVQARARGTEGPFLTTQVGRRINPNTIRKHFRVLCERTAVRRADSARYQPRLHDLRHTFAVHRLTSWYQQGANVQKLLPQLSTYLGHVCIKHTQVYLTMTPELLCEARRRFARYTGQEGHHER
jgi:site-specific recombinase XerD